MSNLNVLTVQGLTGNSVRLRVAIGTPIQSLGGVILWTLKYQNALGEWVLISESSSIPDYVFTYSHPPDSTELAGRDINFSATLEDGGVLMVVFTRLYVNPFIVQPYGTWSGNSRRSVVIVDPSDDESIWVVLEQQ